VVPLPPELPADLQLLVARMVEGGAGAVAIGRPAAAALGLEPRLAVAGFAPVRATDGARWSVAVVVSARRVRDRARVSGWRLLTATGLASLLVGLFGFLVTRQQRRALALAEALRLAEATAALRERSEKIVETIPIGVLALDGAGRVTSVNPYFVERQVAPGDSLGHALGHATALERAELEALVSEARAGRRPIERGGLLIHLGPDAPREVDAYAIPLARPLPDADFYLALHDRTEMRVLERNLVRAEKLATIGTLAAGVAHEVGTPLGIISGRAEQLLAKIGENDPMRKPLSTILAQVDKVSATIRQLLDFARVRPIEAAEVTPTQALETARALLEHRFRQAKVELVVDAPPSVPAILADAGQLEQVLVNLLMNAVDACGAGGHVRATAVARGERVCFAISDDGQGIAPEHLPSVLDPFFTTKKRGQGTGLGLTIAADIVKNHGGALEIASTPGRGTTVEVHLPIARPQP
jgi:signal transduction histidine kinase